MVHFFASGVVVPKGNGIYASLAVAPIAIGEGKGPAYAKASAGERNAFMP